MSGSLLQSNEGAQTPEVKIRWDGEVVSAREGDTVSAGLLRASVLATTRSIKFRRRRGPYCLRGDCGTCLVRIDGVPNRRACMTAVAPGMRVEPQNRVGVGTAFDPTAVVDRVLGKALDHHHFMVRPRIVNRVMQGVARNLAGLGTLPDEVAPPSPPALTRSVDVLVIGGGHAGQAATARLRAAGLDVLCFDRRDRAPGTNAGVELEAGVFAAYTGEKLWAAVDRDGRLHRVAPRHAIVATGARDPMLPIPRNDLPGTLAARGLLDLLARCGARIAGNVVVIGDGPFADEASARLGAPLVSEDDVVAVIGSRRVQAVKTTSGKLPCRIAALAPAPAPAFELAKQSGAEVRFDGAGFAVVRDPSGRCRSRGPWGLWAAGDIAGYVGPDAARADGARVAAAVIAACREGAR